MIFCHPLLSLPSFERSCRLLEQATGALTPLARFTVRNMWVAFTSTQGKALGLQLSLPWVEGEDMRPWVPREHALVISSSDQASDSTRTPASLLTMHWAAEAELARQKLQVAPTPCSSSGPHLLDATQL